MEENITQQALEELAERLNSSNQEVLCDVDHGSCKPGVDKNSEATGWFSKFVVHPLKGLFGLLKLTAKGRELVSERAYRFLSPVFRLDENGFPVELHSVAMTNVPAFAGHIRPILNAEPTNEVKEMSKEEIVELVRNTIAEMNAPKCENECCEKPEEVKNEEPEQAPVEQPVEQEQPKAEEEEKVVEETTTTETTTVSTNEEGQPEKMTKEVEVIKEEVLNSAPTQMANITDPEWKHLHGEEFFRWLAKNR